MQYSPSILQTSHKVMPSSQYGLTTEDEGNKHTIENFPKPTTKDLNSAKPVYDYIENIAEKHSVDIRR